MLTPDNGGRHTEFGAVARAKCCCCGSSESACFVYPLQLVTRMICQECVRGAVVASGREYRRRAEEAKKA